MSPDLDPLPGATPVDRPVADVAEEAYRDYAMYTMHERALPDVPDGLKPVQRRIIYAMHELGLAPDAKPKKSAKTIGHVLGAYHPHGESACYEAMALMAQPFSLRYPLVDGQGNWGSADDPKSFAAMRYTEARLTAYADTLLAEVAAGACAMTENFDHTTTEPVTLPARLPNVLLNGATGIAVGMATDIPAHHVRDVAAAALAVLDDPAADDETLLAHVPGPDFATGATVISSPDQIAAAYRTGRGALKVRAHWRVADRRRVVIDELPPAVAGAAVVAQLARCIEEGFTALTGVLDESDHEAPTRIVLELRPGADPDAVLEHLCATTDLEKTVKVNLTALGPDGTPRRKSLPTLLREWVDARLRTVTRRITRRLEKIRAELHRLGAYLDALDALDDVIDIVRNHDDPKTALQARLQIDATQADALLALRLRALARLEETRIRARVAALEEEKTTKEARLADPVRLRRHVAKQLRADAAAFDDPRRTRLAPASSARARRPGAADPTLAGPGVAVTVALSRLGFARVAKGHETRPDALGHAEGDAPFLHARTRSNARLAVLDSTGRAFSVPVADLPSAKGFGAPLARHLRLAPDATPVDLVACDAPEQPLLALTTAGYGFRCHARDLLAEKRAGKQLLTVPAGADVLPLARLDTADARLALLSSDGRLLVIDPAQVNVLPKGKGVKLIALPGPVHLLDYAVLAPQASLTVACETAAPVVLAPAAWRRHEGQRATRGLKTRAKSPTRLATP